MKKVFHVFLFVLFAVLMCQTAWAANVNVSITGQSVNMPKTGTNNATISASVKSFKIYDDGGSSGAYSDECDGSLVLTVPSGYVLQLTGFVATEKPSSSSSTSTGTIYDYLEIYNGNSVSSGSLILKTYSETSGVVRYIETITSKGQSLTLRFKSDASNHYSGFDITVTLVKLTLKLPSGANKFVNMVRQHKATLNIPTDVSSFNVYDDGGSSGSYTGSNSDTLVMTAPSGYVLQLTGSVTTEKPGSSSSTSTGTIYDYLEVYDGNSVSSSNLVLKKYSATSGTAVDIGRLLTKGRYMTLYFKSDKSDHFAGLNLTVTLIPVTNQIAYKNANTGGSVSSTSPTTGKIDSTVNYSYTYNNGYLVSNIIAAAANGDAVMVSGGWYNNGKASFKMPPSNVTVTSVYTNNWSAAGGLYIDMPKKGTVNATIPAGVTSFNIYDDGGLIEAYSDSCDGTLALTVPSGYVLQLTGTVTTEKPSSSSSTSTGTIYDYLEIYNGNSVSSGSLILKAYSETSGVARSIGTISSSGQSLTLRFKSDASKHYSGLNITVTLVKLTLELPSGANKFVNMIRQHKATLNIPTDVSSFSVYDDGGNSGSYTGSNSDTLVMTAPSGYVLQLTGSVTTEKPGSSSSTSTGTIYDYLEVYDGNSVSSSDLILKKYSATSGTAVDIGRLLTKGRYMTLYFKSDKSDHYAGLNLTVTLIPVTNQIAYKNANTGGSVSSTSPTTGKIDSTVNYSYTYNNGYLVSNIKATAANGDVVTVSGGWYNNGKASFKMPPSTVTVTSTYTNNWSVAGGLYINMPKKGTVNATIPTGVTSFTIYDDGGSSGAYSDTCDGTLALTVPAGYVLQLTGTVTTEKPGSSSSTSTGTIYDYLEIYNGNSVSSGSLILKTYSETSGIARSIGTITSKGQSLTLRFKSDASKHYSGLDITATLYKLVLELPEGTNKFVNMVRQRKALLNITTDVSSFNVYDDGGSNGSYTGSNSDTLVLVAPEGCSLQLTGTVTTEKPGSSSSTSTGTIYDYLEVYDGNSVSSSNLVLKKYSATSGTAVDIGTVTSNGRYMTLYFKSDASDHYAGLNLTVQVIRLDYSIAVNSAANGRIVASKSRSFADSIISLVSYPNTNYMLKEVSVKDASGNSVKVSQYSFGDAEFTMPAKNVTVSPTFTNNLTAAGGLHLDMRRNKSFAANIPTGVKSFKIYDNGGKDGNYANKSSDTLVLKAPAGYRMKLSGNVKTEKYFDSLYVFDGNSTTATSLSTISGPMTSTSASSYIGIATCTSSGEYMTLRFKSDGSTNYDGLDLTVTLEQINYTITKASVTGGTLYGKDKDTLGAEVYLMGSPTGGYRLSGMKVVDKDNNIIKSPVYAFERAKFIMPASNVTATPTWTNNLTAEGGLHLDMLKNKKTDEDIPRGIKSFMLYDNGGKNGLYEKNSSDTLILNAPEGFYLNVTGTITLEKGCDSLYIFDGTTTSTTKLFGRSSTTSGIEYDIGTITSSGHSLTFLFKSDYSVQKNGLNLKVTVEPITYGIAIADAANGRVSSDKTKAAEDSIVNLSWLYTTGYLIRDIDVQDASNNKIAVNGGWYSGAKASFTMPASPVIVTPTFTNNLTAEGDDGLYINMPKTGTVNAVIPNRVTSFKVYDDGGASGAYSNGCNGTLVLNAPEGYLLQLSGKVYTENPNTSGTIYDYLDVYDGADNTATKLVNKKTGASATVSEVRSTGRNLTLFFHSDGSGVRDGLDLTVSVVPNVIKINLASVLNGNVEINKTSANPDEIVTLNAIPAKGYLFDGVSVVDADGNEIDLFTMGSDDKSVFYHDDIRWYSNINEVSFSVPVKDVTVTPKFTSINALSVNMPKTGSVYVNIPSFVESFKVNDESYNESINGQLYLNPLDDYHTVRVTGNVDMQSGDKFGVVNGMHYNSALEILDTLYKYSSDNRVVDETASQGALLTANAKNASAARFDLTIHNVNMKFGAVTIAHVKGMGAWGSLFGVREGMESMALVYDDAIAERIDIPEDTPVDTVIYARDFKTGVYTTIVFPFNLKADSLTGVQKVLRFNGFKQKEDKSWVVRMKRVWTTDSVGRDIEISANTPYLLVMDDGKLVVRGGVTLKKTVEPIAMAEDCNWKFVGTLAYQEWPEGDPLVYGFSNNQFVKAGKNVSVKPLRAYLLKPEPKQASGRPSLNGSAYTYESITPMDIPDEFDIVEDDDENGENTTVIGRYNTRTGEFRMLPSYDIKGRKLNGKPNVHKAYYGKKVIRK